METEFYLPMLKSKAGEFAALSKLSMEHKKRVIPLFEVTHIEFDHANNNKPKTLKEHLLNFSKKVVKGWPANKLFIDTNFINDKSVDGTECIEFIFSELSKNGIFPMPVVYTSSQPKLLGSVNKILETNPMKEIGIRVTIEDIISISFEENINNILTQLKTSFTNCHIILDLKNADFSQKEDFAEAIIDELKGFPSLEKWKSFTIAGGAFPSIGTIKTEEQLVPRNDWNFYIYVIEKLSKEVFNRPINYGDYSIVAPGYFEFDPVKMKVSANIRYTHDNHWLVLKGKALKKSADWQQYFGQAQRIIDSKYYLGENFSDGDLHIKKCANRETTSGNANTWIAVGNNHHFTKVLTDLFSKNS